MRSVKRYFYSVVPVVVSFVILFPPLLVRYSRLSVASKNVSHVHSFPTTVL